VGPKIACPDSSADAGGWEGTAMVRNRRIILAVGAALLALAIPLLCSGPMRAAAPGARMQRMSIGVGCDQIGAHATGAVAAYGLDQAGTAPRRGAIAGVGGRDGFDRRQNGLWSLVTTAAGPDPCAVND